VPGRVSYAPHAGCDTRTRYLDMTEYANWQSDEVESLVPVGSTPTSVTDSLILWSNGKGAWVTTRKVMVRFHPRSLRCENTLVCRR
jgi:hypothetical protein